MSLSKFHQWLCKQRVYCQYCMNLATTVVKDAAGHDICLCDQCAGKPREAKSEWDYVPKSKRFSMQ